MYNEIQTFEFVNDKVSSQVRAVEINSEPWFVGNDVSMILGYSNYRNAVANHVDDEDKLRTQIEYAGQKREVTVINESGLYSLILSSKLSTAKKFKRWVTSEVLPTIRKHGAYMTQEKIEEALLNPDTIIKLAQELKRERERRLIAEQRINELTPKASYYDLILQNKTLMTITQIAKDYGMSGEAMNKKLHELKVIYKRSNVWLLYSKYQDKGWTQSTSKLVNDGKKLVFHTKWTQKGRLGLYELLKQHEILPLIEREDEVQEAQS